LHCRAVPSIIDARAMSDVVPDPAATGGSAREGGKARDRFRDFAAEARSSVKEFYRLNHTRQTFEFVRAKEAEYLPLRRQRMGIWEAVAYLQQVVDDSDPDLDLPQLEHALQTAEALRRAGQPRWLILAGFIHDLGKVLCLFGEPQWAVVGDTFPVGCAFAPEIVFHELFAANPDSANPRYGTRTGIYAAHCGLDEVHMSWGHDEYLYHVVKSYLPEEAGYIIRYHSFYPAHREGSYGWLLNERDHALMQRVRAFNPYDLYSKSAERPDWLALRPFYEDLVTEFLPPILQW
jgi:inositol oxygenase